MSAFAENSGVPVMTRAAQMVEWAALPFLT
jgi:hypothetical protein